MPKFASTLLVIFALITVTTQAPVLGQSVQNKPDAETVSQAKPQPDLKKVFTAETDRFKADSAAFDPVKTERQAARQQAQKKGWSKTKKTLVFTAIAVGFAALIFVAIKYGKKCLRYSDNCTYDPQTGIEDCPCEEYEQRNP